DELVEEWQASQPDALKRIEQMRGAARKAWRWTGEMEEIAATFTEVGLPAGFHLAAHEIYERLAAFKDASTTPSAAEILVALRVKSARPGE
ncbi:MAG: DUF1932 domain-containing protein, partial [Burkholderiales bacterium]